MPRTNIIFDIYAPEEFFYSINTAWENYKRGKQKSVELLLFVIMGLNHLREWIAPKYSHKKPPTNDAENFYNLIFDNTSFKTINGICNKSKHLQQIKENTSSIHNVPFDEWSDIDAVRDWDRGPASDYFIDGINIIEIVEKVIRFYDTEWFKKKGIVFK